MRALAAAALLSALLPFGMGCWGEGDSGGEKLGGAERPELATWDLPLSEGPELLSNDIQVIYCDDEGILWFGTASGVSRYDPKIGSFQTLTKKDDLATSSVSSIAADNGAIWFGTLGGGVSRYDKRSRSFKTFKKKDGLAGDRVRAIAVGDGGKIWFATDDGASVYDPMTNLWKPVPKKDGLGDNLALTSVAYSKGVVWFGTLGGGAGRYEVKSGSWSMITKRDKLVSDRVLAIAVDGSGAIWFGTPEGVSRYDPSALLWETFTGTKKNDDLVSKNVLAIASDEKNHTIWFGTDAGVSGYELSSRSWGKVTKSEGLAKDAIRTIAVDSTSGSLWLGSDRSGVVRYEPKNGTKTLFMKKAGIAGEEVHAIEQSSEGALWFGTTAGAARYDPTNGSWNTFTQQDSGLANDNVQAIAAGANGELWFGTHSGISRYDEKRGFWKTLTPRDDPADNDVRAILVDRNKVLWFGTFGAGVTRYEESTGAFKKFSRKNGLVDDYVQAISPDADGGLWFGTSGGVSRFDEKSGAFRTFTRKDGFGYHDVQAISRSEDDGGLWFGAFGGIGRYDIKSRSFGQLQEREGPAYDEVHAIAAGADGELWFGASGRANRYDVKLKSWKTVTKEDGLPGGEVSAIWAKDRGSVWIGTDQGASRLVLAGSLAEAGALLTTLPPRPRITALSSSLAVTRPSGVSRVDVQRPDQPRLISALTSFPSGSDVTALAPGPGSDLWVGTSLSGLTLRRISGGDLQLTKDLLGLRSMTVTALAPVAASNAKVWVGTSAGTALVSVKDDRLWVERVFDWDGMPTGPVDAIAADSDKAVFIAYNSISKSRFLDPLLAERRARTRVFRVPLAGNPKEVPANDAFSRSEVRALALSEEHGLFAATSKGLFVAKNASAADADAGPGASGGFEQETGQGRLPLIPLRLLAIAKDKPETVFMAADRLGDRQPYLISYRPSTASVEEIAQAPSAPSADAIDDMTFLADGHLVVLVGSTLERTRRPVFIPPPAPAVTTALPAWVLFVSVAVCVAAIMVSAVLIMLRRSAYIRVPLSEVALPAIPGVLRRLRRYRALEENWSYRGLPKARIPLLETLAASNPPGAPQLHALAELLGMENAHLAEVELFPYGLSLLRARLPYPMPLRGRPIALIAFDLSEAREAEPSRVRAALQTALDKAGQRFELPFLLLAREEVSGAILPADLRSFRLGERELKALLFASDPEHTFAGLLHARQLLALSPYTTAGEVKDEQMFFGRVALLKELLLASSVQQIVIGSRRVGKTSLLKRLLRELHAHRPEVEAIFVDLFGITDHAHAGRALARAFKADLPGGAEPETALVDVIRARFQAKGKKIVALIDEADGLVDADAKKGFPLLSAMRRIQAEDACSFVLAGYRYLYRETLNQHSPLYNFATPRILGPLDAEAAHDLALTPMQSLGVAYASPLLPAQIARRTGGYPSIVQSLCDAALEVLRESKTFDLMLTAGHLKLAEQKVARELRDFFRSNVEDDAQSMIFHLLAEEEFSTADAERALLLAKGSAPARKAVEQLLRELRLFGFVVERGEGRFTWAIPLLRDTLLAADAALAEARIEGA